MADLLNQILQVEESEVTIDVSLRAQGVFLLTVGTLLVTQYHLRFRLNRDLQAHRVLGIS